MHQFFPDPFLTYVVGAEHDARLRRAADERRRRHQRHRSRHRRQAVRNS